MQCWHQILLRKQKKDFKERAQQIFVKISSTLGFQHISYHNEGNDSSGGRDTNMRKNIVGIKGKPHLSQMIFEET